MDEDADAARIDPNKHPLTDMPPSASDVYVAHKFAEGLPDDRVITLGNNVRVLVAFANAGKSMYHVWGVMGSLNMQNKFNMYVQNFTYHVVNKSVNAASELSLAYTFQPNERLDTRPFQLSLSIFYEAQSSSGNAIRGHSTTFFNETITTKAGPQSINNTTFMLLVVLVMGGVAGGIAFAMSSGSDQKRTAATELGTTESKESEWLEEHSRTMQSGGGRAAPSKLTKRK